MPRDEGLGERDLTTTRSQVFGDVQPGTECRVCGRDVDDGRSKTCSDYCNNLLSAVMGMLNWSSVRRKVIERDDETCQVCDFDYGAELRARDHIKALIADRAGERPKSPGARELGAGEVEDFDWDDHHDRFNEWRERTKELQERYGDPYETERTLEVDHVQPVADGGHPFGPGNLQTLCEYCHREKTADENSERKRTPSRGDLSQSLFEYVADGGDDSGG